MEMPLPDIPFVKTIDGVVVYDGLLLYHLSYYPCVVGSPLVFRFSAFVSDFYRLHGVLLVSGIGGEDDVLVPVSECYADLANMISVIL